MLRTRADFWIFPVSYTLEREIAEKNCANPFAASQGLLSRTQPAALRQPDAKTPRPFPACRPGRPGRPGLRAGEGMAYIWHSMAAVLQAPAPQAVKRRAVQRKIDRPGQGGEKRMRPLADRRSSFEEFRSSTHKHSMSLAPRLQVGRRGQQTSMIQGAFMHPLQTFCPYLFGISGPCPRRPWTFVRRCTAAGGFLQRLPKRV